MNKTLIFRKIGGIISEISEQYQYLSADPENLNPLELELFVANSHFLSEHLAIMKKLYSGPDAGNVTHFSRHVQVNEPLLSMNIPGLEINDQPADLPNIEPAVVPEPDGIAFKPDNVKQDNELLKSPDIFSKESEENRILDPQIADVSHGPAKETIELPVTFLSEPEPVPVVLDEVKEMSGNGNALSFASQQSHPAAEDRVPTLNEILSAAKKTEAVSMNITQNHDKDLKSMIKLNDKLMFVRDLFNGYSLAYSEAIDFINRFDSFEAADKFLKQNYAEKNKWSEKQNSVDQFYEVLVRRFS